jgi:hypothetical protein
MESASIGFSLYGKQSLSFPYSEGAIPAPGEFFQVDGSTASSTIPRAFSSSGFGGIVSDDSGVHRADGAPVIIFGATINGIGTAETILGGDGDDRFYMYAPDLQTFDGRSGNNKVVLVGEGMTIDLTTGPEKLHAIQAINLADDVSNTLILDEASLIRLTGDSHALHVTGFDSDVLIVKGKLDDTHWQRLDDEADTGNHRFQEGAAILIIGTNMHITFESAAAAGAAAG